MSAAEATNVVTIPKAPQYKVKEAQVVRFEYENTVWSVSVDPKVPFDEILKPEFWAHVVGPKSFKAGDEIKVTPYDYSWRAVLIVRDCGSNWAKVALLDKKEFEMPAQASASAVPGFRVEWQGIADKHVVIREKDGAVIAKGFKKLPEAQIAMIEHARQVGAA